MQEIGIEFLVTGVENVNAAFEQISANVERFSDQVNGSFVDASSSLREFGDQTGIMSSQMAAGAEGVNAGLEQISVMSEKCAVSSTISFTDASDSLRNFGDSAVEASSRVSDSVESIDVNYRRLMATSAGVIANSVQLGDIMDRMAKGQMDVGRGAVMLAMNFLQLGAQLYMLNSAYAGVIAQKMASLGLDIQETVASAAHTVAEGARNAVLGLSKTIHAGLNALKTSTIFLDAQEAAGAIAHAAAEGVRQIAIWATVAAEKARAIAEVIANALAGPWGWAILAGAAVAITAGLALTGQIPGAAEGAIVEKPTVMKIAEREPEVIIPVSKFNKFVENIATEIGKTEAYIAESSVFFNEKLSTVTSKIFESSDVGVYKKASPLEFLSGPLAGTQEAAGPKIINVYIKDPIFRSRGDLDYLADRLKRMGLA